MGCYCRHLVNIALDMRANAAAPPAVQTADRLLPPPPQLGCCRGPWAGRAAGGGQLGLEAAGDDGHVSCGRVDLPLSPLALGQPLVTVINYISAATRVGGASGSLGLVGWPLSHAPKMVAADAPYRRHHRPLRGRRF